MPHFPAGTGLRFSVKMEFEFGVLKDFFPRRRVVFRPEIAEEIDHHDGREEFGRARREAADGANVLFKLAANTGIERVMTGIVRTRGEFVDEKRAVVANKKFDGEKAYHIETIGYFLRERVSEVGEGSGKIGRDDGGIEDVIPV